MLVVEDEKEVSQCGSIKEMVEDRPPIWEARFYRSKTSTSKTSTTVKSAAGKSAAGKRKSTTTQRPASYTNTTEMVDAYSINRYRKDPLSYGDRHGYCHNYFPNENMIFKCSSDAARTVPSSLASLVYGLVVLFFSMTLIG